MNIYQYHIKIINFSRLNVLYILNEETLKLYKSVTLFTNYVYKLKI